MKNKIILCVVLSSVMTAHPSLDPKDFLPHFTDLTEWISNWAPLLQVGIGIVTIKSATSTIKNTPPQYYSFNKYPSKYLNNGVNKLNEVNNLDSLQQLGAGKFPAAEPFLETDLLTDPQGNALLSSLQPNSTAVTFHADPAGNKARSIIIVAKNSISTDPAQKPIVIVNSISIDLETLIGYIGQQFLYKVFPWTPATIPEAVPTRGTYPRRIILLNITFDAVTADISLDSIDIRYLVIDRLDLFNGWVTAPRYIVNQALLNQNVGITILPNIDLSQTKN